MGTDDLEVSQGNKPFAGNALQYCAPCVEAVTAVMYGTGLIN
jgi:hypothetical protein